MSKNPDCGYIEQLGYAVDSRCHKPSSFRIAEITNNGEKYNNYFCRTCAIEYLNRVNRDYIRHIYRLKAGKDIFEVSFKEFKVIPPMRLVDYRRGILY